MSGERKPAVLCENNVFAVRLVSLMTEHNETQKELSDTLGVKQQTISYYRHGQSLPDVERLTKIAQHYNVSTDWLLGLSEYRTHTVETVTAAELGLSEKSIHTLQDLDATISEIGLNSIFNNKFELFVLAIGAAVAQLQSSGEQTNLGKMIGEYDPEAVSLLEETGYAYKLLTKSYGSNFRVVSGEELASLAHFELQETTTAFMNECIQEYSTALNIAKQGDTDDV